MHRLRLSSGQFRPPALGHHLDHTEVSDGHLPAPGVFVLVCQHIIIFFFYLHKLLYTRLLPSASLDTYEDHT